MLRLCYAVIIRDLLETSQIDGKKGDFEMEYKLSEAEAKILVVASNSPIKENYADFLAVKLNMNSSHVSGLLRRLELAKCLTIVNNGKKRLIENVTLEALECSKKLLQS